ncbi:MAG: outer membrane beta-barrel protein [Candidatus Zixiibacteriota bacterium]
MRISVCSLLVLALLAPPVLSIGPKLGVGASVGLDIPIGQDEQSQGTIFGFRGRVNLIPMITVEPNISFTRYGDPDLEGVTSNLEGSKIMAYGVDVALGMGFGAPGFNPYGLVGAGYYNVKRDQTGQDDTDLGYSAGLGFELGFAVPIAVDVRGKLVVIPIEGASKKSATVMGGLHYYFGK